VRGGRERGSDVASKRERGSEGGRPLAFIPSGSSSRSLPGVSASAPAVAAEGLHRRRRQKHPRGPPRPTVSTLVPSLPARPTALAAPPEVCAVRRACAALRVALRAGAAHHGDGAWRVARRDRDACRRAVPADDRKRVPGPDVSTSLTPQSPPPSTVSCPPAHTHTHTHTHTYTRISTHTRAYTHALAHTHMHTHIHTHAHAHTHIHTHIHTHTRTPTPTPTHAHRPTHTHTHTRIHTHTHIRVQTLTHMQTPTHTHTHTHTHRHTHTHSRIHTDAHAHAHTHTDSLANRDARTHAGTHTHLQRHTHPHRHTQEHTDTHAQTHAHTRTRARTHTRTHARTHAGDVRVALLPLPTARCALGRPSLPHSARSALARQAAHRRRLPAVHQRVQADADDLLDVRHGPGACTADNASGARAPYPL
jgi:hypothetical protein